MRKILYALLICTAAGSFGQDKELLFNGKDLDNWIVYVKNNEVKAEDYVYVKDGVIETIGKPVGYLYTKKAYSNYKLHVEWCYPEKAKNSGILLHANGPDLIWKSHYQAQLKHQNAGDFIVHGVDRRATLADVDYVSTESDKPLIPKMHPTNENPAGEWNSFDITCKGDFIEIRVNGLVQNVAYNLSETAGNIGLQIEGCKIQFRNLWIEPL